MFTPAAGHPLLMIRCHHRCVVPHLFHALIPTMPQASRGGTVDIWKGAGDMGIATVVLGVAFGR